MIDGFWNRLEEPRNLHAWVKYFLHINVPSAPVCPHHDAPLDYLWHAYHEPAGDAVVWAPRGGGKTRLGAAATVLDLVHKPGVDVRILGGSLEQSVRFWEHLLPDLERLRAYGVFGDRPARVGPGHVVELSNGSTAAAVAQSQRAVRGLHVQKLRCDEVELFDPRVWEAAQFVTRTRPCGDVRVAGCVEAISTLHEPYGLMDAVVERAKGGASPARVIKWCVLDVLEKCPPERDCASCPLWDECRGVAKHKCDGFYAIDDAIRAKQRSSVEKWDAEMLCNRPSVSGCVFPSFDEKVHVAGQLAVGSGQLAGEPAAANRQPPTANPMTLALDFGFRNPFVCLWVAAGDDGVVHVVDEYVQEQRTLEEHLAEIEARRWGKVRRVACDPAGGSRNDQTAESNVALLRRRGYTVRTRASRIADGLELIRCALKPAAGVPRLFVAPHCRRLIKALRSYHYPRGGGELPLKDGEHDHLIDALRYYFVNAQTGGRVEVREY